MKMSKSVDALRQTHDHTHEENNLKKLAGNGKQVSSNEESENQVSCELKGDVYHAVSQSALSAKSDMSNEEDVLKPINIQDTMGNDDPENVKTVTNPKSHLIYDKNEYAVVKKHIGIKRKYHGCTNDKKPWGPKESEEYCPKCYYECTKEEDEEDIDENITATVTGGLFDQEEEPAKVAKILKNENSPSECDDIDDGQNFSSTSHSSSSSDGDSRKNYSSNSIGESGNYSNDSSEERSEVTKLFTSKPLYDAAYIYQKDRKTMVENLLKRELMAQKFNLEVTRTAEYIKSYQKLFGGQCLDKVCVTERVIQGLNKTLGNTVVEEEYKEFWSFLMILHSNNCSNGKRCRVYLCHDYKDLIDELIVPNLPMPDQESIDFSLKLGKGTFGCVYHVLVSNGGILESFVVKKTMTLEKDREDYYKALKQSMTHCEKINCQNILTPSRRTEEFLKMEYAGISLAEYAEQQSGIPANGCLFISFGIVNGLDYLHGKGLVHCDIKPQNVVLCWQHDDSFIPMLIDLDFVNKVGNLQAGSYGYVGPEVKNKGTVKGTGVITESDMYSFGRTIYKMRLGKEGGAMSTDEMTSKLKYTIGDDRCSELLLKIFISCTQKDPQKRATSLHVIEWLKSLKPLWECYRPMHYGYDGSKALLVDTPENIKCQSKMFLKHIFNKVLKNYGRPNIEECF